MQLSPYTIAYQHGGAVGIIDFDYASPEPRLWDLAYSAYRIVPVSTDHADGFTFTEREARLVGCSRSTGRLPPQPISST